VCYSCNDEITINDYKKCISENPDCPKYAKSMLMTNNSITLLQEIGRLINQPSMYLGTKIKENIDGIGYKTELNYMHFFFDMLILPTR
jgi:hypothetical protein